MAHWHMAHNVWHVLWSLKNKNNFLMKKEEEEISRKILKIKDNCPCSLSLLIESPPMAKKAIACSLHMRSEENKEHKYSKYTKNCKLLVIILIFWTICWSTAISIPLAVCKSAINIQAQPWPVDIWEKNYLWNQLFHSVEYPSNLDLDLEDTKRKLIDLVAIVLLPCSWGEKEAGNWWRLNIEDAYED